MRTEEAYVYWSRWFIRFHGLRHPAEMGGPEVQTFLSHLSNERKCSLSTHRQALCALLFLYKHVLKKELPWMEELPRPTRLPIRPTVLTRTEVDMLLAQMSGTHALIARLLYGTGNREAAKERKRDTRRKILAGAYVIKLAENDLQRVGRELISAGMPEPRDYALFGLSVNGTSSE